MEQDFMAAPWLILTLVGAGLVLMGVLAVVLTTSVYKHIICMKYLFSGWKAVVPIVSALPAALGVFLLILVFSIMDGFAHETREMTRGTLSDIIVDSHLEGLPYYEEYIRKIERIEGVKVATPIVQTFAVVRIKPHREANRSIAMLVPPFVTKCVIIGIRPDEKAEMGRFMEYLQEVKEGRRPATNVLSVPETYRKPGGAPTYGCIAGSGLIGAPKDEWTLMKVQSGVGNRVLAGVGAIAALVVFLCLFRIYRRRPGRAVWRVLVWTAGAVTVGLVVTIFLLPVEMVEVQRKVVVDYPLMDFGDTLPIMTIPVTSRGLKTIDGRFAAVSSREFVLVDIFKSGYWEADSNQIYVDFKMAQELAGMEGLEAQPATDAQPALPAIPARASQVQVRVDETKITTLEQRKELCNTLRNAWADLAREKPDIGLLRLSVNTWEEQQKMILTVVEVEKNVTVLMLGMMFLGFGILIALISYVMAFIKSRDVGILKAVGARDAGVGSLFLGYGFVIGLVGMVVGMVAALLVLQNLDAIELWVNATLNINIFPRETYYFDHIPRRVSTWWCVGVGASVLVLSTLASLAGGLFAAMRQPVETLRYE
jgi:ABC-type lipoprotein release transport system permease subunit